MIYNNKLDFKFILFEKMCLNSINKNIYNFTFNIIENKYIKYLIIDHIINNPNYTPEEIIKTYYKYSFKNNLSFIFFDKNILRVIDYLVKNNQYNLIEEEFIRIYGKDSLEKIISEALFKTHKNLIKEEIINIKKQFIELNNKHIIKEQKNFEKNYNQYLENFKKKQEFLEKKHNEYLKNIPDNQEEIIENISNIIPNKLSISYNNFIEPILLKLEIYLSNIIYKEFFKYYSIFKEEKEEELLSSFYNFLKEMQFDNRKNSKFLLESYSDSIRSVVFTNQQIIGYLYKLKFFYIFKESIQLYKKTIIIDKTYIKFQGIFLHFIVYMLHNLETKNKLKFIENIKNLHIKNLHIYNYIEIILLENFHEIKFDFEINNMDNFFLDLNNFKNLTFNLSDNIIFYFIYSLYFDYHFEVSPEKNIIINNILNFLLKKFFLNKDENYINNKILLKNIEQYKTIKDILNSQKINKEHLNSIKFKDKNNIEIYNFILTQLENDNYLQYLFLSCLFQNEKHKTIPEHILINNNKLYVDDILKTISTKKVSYIYSITKIIKILIYLINSGKLKKLYEKFIDLYGQEYITQIENNNKKFNDKFFKSQNLYEEFKKVEEFKKIEEFKKVEEFKKIEELKKADKFKKTEEFRKEKEFNEIFKNTFRFIDPSIFEQDNHKIIKQWKKEYNEFIKNY